MPRIVDKNERRAALINAALAVFSERGYHGATMQAVAERAGVSKGGVYAYFSSKEELLLTSADTFITALFEQSLAMLEREGTIQERIERFVRSLLDGVDEWTEVCFSILQVWAELGPGEDQPLKAMMAAAYSKSADRFQAALDAAVERGEIAPQPTRAAGLAIMATLDGMVLQAIAAPDEFRESMATGLLVRWCGAIVSLPAKEEGK